jgi:hypothetical protein
VRGPQRHKLKTLYAVMLFDSSPCFVCGTPVDMLPLTVSPAGVDSFWLIDEGLETAGLAARHAHCCDRISQVIADASES